MNDYDAPASEVEAEPGRGEVLFTMSDSALADTTIGRFAGWLKDSRGVSAENYGELHAWSTANLSDFWTSIVEFFQVHLEGHASRCLVGDRMPDIQWFPDATVNYAEHAVRGDPAVEALVGLSQLRDRQSYTYDELRSAVGRCRAGLVQLGVGPGDVVCGYLPNICETVIAFLAAASLGATWSVCSPEVGVRGVVGRFAQIGPKVLIAADGYVFGTKHIDRRDEVKLIADALPSLRAVVVLPLLSDGDRRSEWLSWDQLLRASPERLEFVQVPFDHRLIVVFSSGTTGPPKPIVHGHGGVLLEHLKWLGLHFDIKPADRFMWHSSTSWIMWSVGVSALLMGATVVLFDGDPMYPGPECLWDLAASERLSCLGMGASLLVACERAGFAPDPEKLRSLRTLGSTGSPLPVHSYYWMYRHLPGIYLSSVSGGTDVATAFIGGCPMLPVYAGEISGACLGVDGAAVDASGAELIDERGELVVKQPMPSMPVAIWGDASGARLRSSYFEVFDGLWRHGDWVTHTSHGSWVVEGRSDATLNRGGIRLGTGEYYELLNEEPSIVDSLVVFLDGQAGEVGKLILFVQPAEGVVIDDDYYAYLRTRIRRDLSPRHVPDEIYQVAAIPVTHSGKKLEVPVKRLLAGLPRNEAVAVEAVANVSSLAEYEQIRARRHASTTASLRESHRPMERPKRMLNDATFSFLALSRPAPGVVLAEMKNPQNRNLARQRDQDEFGRLMAEAKSDPEARVIVIAGHGGVFSEGDEHSNDPYDPEDYYSRSSNFIHHFVNTDMPVIVALNGDVRGLGLTIALLADVLVVERQVTLCDVQVLKGFASATGPFLWPLSTGFMRAKRYLLTGDAFSAEEAVEMGLATEVVDEGNGVARALDYAERLARLRPESLQATKHNMNQWLRMVSDPVLNHGLAREFLTFPQEYAATTQ